MKHVIPLTDAAPDVDMIEADYLLTDEMVEMLSGAAPLSKDHGGGVAARQVQRNQTLKQFFEGEDEDDETEAC